MLYLVLLLVLGSLGLLLTALRSHDTLWAWASVGVSVVAAVLLLFDWAGRRLAADKKSRAAQAVEPDTAGSATEPEPTPAETTAPVPPAGATGPTDGSTESGGQSSGSAHDTTQADSSAASTETPEPSGPAATGDRTAGRHLATGNTARHAMPSRPGYRTPSRVAPAAGPGSVPVSLDPAVEPPEEDTDAADALRVAELSDEVRVLDERPRYHLSGCAWVGERFTLPLPVHEARELGFSPCGLCRPDALLTQRHHSTAS